MGQTNKQFKVDATITSLFKGLLTRDDVSDRKIDYTIFKN